MWQVSLADEYFGTFAYIGGRGGFGFLRSVNRNIGSAYGAGLYLYLATSWRPTRPWMYGCSAGSWHMVFNPTVHLCPHPVTYLTFGKLTSNTHARPTRYNHFSGFTHLQH